MLLECAAADKWLQTRDQADQYTESAARFIEKILQFAGCNRIVVHHTPRLYHQLIAYEHTRAEEAKK